MHQARPIRSTSGATFDCQTLILPPLRSNAVASIASCQHGTAGFAEDDFSRMAELLDTALAVAHADPETAPVCAAAPRTELRSCPTKSLTNPPGRHRVAQAVLSPCDWSEKRCVSTDCPSYIPLNAEPVTYHLPRKGTRWRPDLLRMSELRDSNFLATASLPARFARSSRVSNRLACPQGRHRFLDLPGF